MMKKQIILIFLFMAHISEARSASNEPIIAAEYFFDNDPGIGNGIPIAFSQEGVFFTNIVIPTNLAVGSHILAVRVKNANNTWSLFQQQNFYVVKNISTSSAPLEAEYFFDNDPGIGNGSKLTMPLGEVFNGEINILPTFPLGEHLFVVRVKSSENKWSLHRVLQVNVQLPSPLCAEAINLQNPTDNLESINTIKQTNNIITAYNKISGASNVIYRSNKSILLSPQDGGFEVSNGAVFKTELGGCNQL